MNVSGSVVTISNPYAATYEFLNLLQPSCLVVPPTVGLLASVGSVSCCALEADDGFAPLVFELVLVAF